MGGVSAVQSGFNADDTDGEIARLNALVATLRDEIVNLRQQVAPSSDAGDDAFNFINDRDEIAAPTEVADIAVIATASDIAESAAASATDLAIAAITVETASVEISDNLLPYQIYCDRLTFIEGIDIDAARLLAGLGVTRFMDVAAFNAEDVAEVNAMLEASGRISKEGWIEQAALLARGTMTRYARQIENGADCDGETAVSESAVGETTKGESAVSVDVIEVDFTPTRAGATAAAQSNQGLGSDGATVTDEASKPEQNKVIDLGVARQKKSDEAKPIRTRSKQAKRWSAIAASLVLLGSVIALGASVTGKLGNWHEAFQNMAGLLL